MIVDHLTSHIPMIMGAYLIGIGVGWFSPRRWPLSIRILVTITICSFYAGVWLTIERALT